MSESYLRLRREMIVRMEAETRQLLRDPNGIMFRNEGFSIKDNGSWFCGEINAHTAFGGYTGWQLFATFVERGTGRIGPMIVVVDARNMGDWQDACITHP